MNKLALLWSEPHMAFALSLLYIMIRKDAATAYK